MSDAKPVTQGKPCHRHCEKGRAEHAAAGERAGQGRGPLCQAFALAGDGLCGKEARMGRGANAVAGIARRERILGARRVKSGIRFIVMPSVPPQA